MEPTIRQSAVNGKGPIGVFSEASRPNNIRADESSASINNNTTYSFRKNNSDGKYYDEEVASDLRYFDSPLQKTQSLDESALQKSNRSMSSSVKFSHQLRSPKFKLRRLNMAGAISFDETNNDHVGTPSPKTVSSPPRIFSNSWSFGSQKRGLDGVVGSDDETETKKPPSIKLDKSDVPRVKELIFQFDTTDNENYATQKTNNFKAENEDADLTDLQTDSEELRGSDEGSDTNERFQRRAQAKHREDQFIYESKRKPIHFIGLIVVLLVSVLVVPMVVDSALSSKEEDVMAPSLSPSTVEGESLDNLVGTLNQTTISPYTSRPSFPVPTQSRMPSTRPSSSPSVQPSIAPTSLPSGQPTTEPSMEPSKRPTDTPSMEPSYIPSDTPTTASPTTSFPTGSASPTTLFCEIHESDGCDDDDGWIRALHCMVSNSFLTCSIGSCSDIRQGDWPFWELYLTNGSGSSFRIRHNDARTAVLLQEQDDVDGTSWSTLESYTVKPSASEIVFGIPIIGNIPDVERLRTWLVSYNRYGTEIDQIPKVGSLLFTGAADVCS